MSLQGKRTPLPPDYQYAPWQTPTTPHEPAPSGELAALTHRLRDPRACPACEGPTLKHGDLCLGCVRDSAETPWAV